LLGHISIVPEVLQKLQSCTTNYEYIDDEPDVICWMMMLPATLNDIWMTF